MQAYPFLYGSFDMPSRTTWYILAPTLAVSTLLLAVGLSGAWYVHQVNRTVSDSLHEILGAAQSAERTVLAIRDVRMKLHEFLRDGDVAHLDEAVASVATAEAAAVVHRAAGDAGDPLDDTWLDRLPNFHQRLERLRDAKADPDETLALVAVVSEELLGPAERSLAKRQQQATEASSQNQTVAYRIGNVLLLLGVCGAAAGVLIGFGVARSVHRSLVEISVPVRDIAGRLNEVVGPIKVSSNTDLAELDGALRMLANKTADVVKRLQKSQQATLRHEQLAAVGQLAAGLAHELRNPLMSVKLIVQTAAERASQLLHRRDLAVIEDEITRMERMLQTFLDFARPPLPEKQVVDVGELVGNAIEFVRPRAEQQDVQLEYSAPSQKIFVEADSSQMRQVLLNLLINALDALPSGGNVWLEIGVESETLSCDSDDDVDSEMILREDGRERIAELSWIVIRVSDDGPGVSPEVIEHVFEPFVSSKATGIGLGLSISRRIVESHNGLITVRNREESGADFTIYLPAPSVDGASATSQCRYVSQTPTRSP